ncbi:MAG TPA: glycosyltransferase family 2 protein [bacterium]|nr:glycosyltransferase family 2 protein [bacterium]
MVDLSIIIVNYNVKHRLRECLQSIYGNTKKISFEVTIVDNNSRDGSVDMVKSEFPEVELIENHQNLGFAKATNQGLRENKGRYRLLLNPDTIVLPNALDKMVEFMEANSHAGALGCRLLYPDGRLQPSCRSFPTLITAFFENTGLEKLFPKSKVMGRHRIGYWGHNDIREVDQPTGAALMVRGEIISQVGLMDEQFYMYYEDIDWCFRIKKKGWKIYFIPLAQIIHYGGQSAGLNMPKMRIQGYKSRHRFFRKHYGILSEWIVKQMDLLGLILKTLYRTAIISVNSMNGNNHDKQYSRGSREILRDLCGVIRRFWEIWI